MLPTLHQLSIERNKRTSKIRRNKVAAFLGAPQRKGVIYKIATMSPRKPNSARRTFAKVRIIISKKKNICKDTRYRRSFFTSTFCCFS